MSSPSTANADAADSRVLGWAVDCGRDLDYWTTDPALQALECFNNSSDVYYPVLDGELRSANSHAAVVTAKTTTTAVGDEVAAVVGEITAQIISIIGFQATWAADYTAQSFDLLPPVSGPGFDVECLLGGGAANPVNCMTYGPANHETEKSTGSDTLKKFVYLNSVSLSAASKRVDAYAVFNLYRQQYKANDAYDFYATSSLISGTPKDGRSVKEVDARLDPNRGAPMLIDFQPQAMGKYNSTGSLTISATLSGEATTGQTRYGSASGGHEFSISRTWNFYEGQAGGAATSNGGHYARWLGKSKTAKSASGVQTYRVTTGNNVSWNVSAYIVTQ